MKPVVLRHRLEVDDPLTVALDFVIAASAYDLVPGSGPSTFGEPDLRLANRGGARISAAEIAGILERRRTIERALRAIPADASLMNTDNAISWTSMRQLFDGFADIQGVGLAKMTKALHKKRPALIPMLDSVVQRYLADDDLGKHAPFGERALAYVRGYKSDLDCNRAAVLAVQRELARRGHVMSGVRVLDAVIWSAAVDFAPARSSS